MVRGVVSLSGIVGVATAIASCSSEYGSTEPTTSNVPSAEGCTPNVPSGWHGPLVFVESRADAARAGFLHDCAAGTTLAFEGKTDPDPGAGCECACEPSGAYKCNNAAFDFYADDTCKTHCGGTNQSATNACLDFDKTGCPANPYVKVSDAKVVGATCQPKSSPPAAAVWNHLARLCQPDSPPATPACPEGQIPAPKASAPFDATRTCVASLGKLACPPEYSESHVYFDATSIVDARHCKACACGAGAAQCGASISVSDKQCSDGSFPVRDTVPVPSACYRLTNSYDRALFYLTPDGSGATCAPSGGGVEGEVGGTPLTVCCRTR